MKTQYIIASLAIIVSFSIRAQGETKSFREDRNYGIGLTPILNVSTVKTGPGSKTTIFNAGAIVTGTFNINRQIMASIGIGTSSDIFSSSYFSTTYKTTKNTLIAQAGIFGSAYVLDISDKSQVDLQIGLVGILKNGQTKYKDNLGFEQVSTFTSFIFAPAARIEWFITQHLTIHAQTGIVISLINETQSNFNESGITVQIFQPQNLLGQAGFTFYF